MGSSQVRTPWYNSKVKAVVSIPLSNSHGYSTRFRDFPFYPKNTSPAKGCQVYWLGRVFGFWKTGTPYFQFCYQLWVTLGKFFSLDLRTGRSLLSLFEEARRSGQRLGTAFREILWTNWIAQPLTRFASGPQSRSEVQSKLKPAVPAEGSSAWEEEATGEFLKGTPERG